MRTSRNDRIDSTAESVPESRRCTIVHSRIATFWKRRITSSKWSVAFSSRSMIVSSQMVVGHHVWDLAELVALVPKPVARPWGSVKRAAAVQV